MSYYIQMNSVTYGDKVLEFHNKERKLGISVRKLFNPDTNTSEFTISKFICEGNKRVILRKKCYSVNKLKRLCDVIKSTGYECVLDKFDFYSDPNYCEYSEDKIEIVILK